MVPFAQSLVPCNIANLFDNISRTVKRLDPPQGVEISCHSLARALAKFFPVAYRDGYCPRPGFCHSWLVSPESAPREEKLFAFIIDPYPPLVVGGPLLLVTDHPEILSPWEKLYIEDVSVCPDSQKLLEEVEAVSNAVRRAIKQ